MKTALSTKVKLSYGVGDFGTNLVLQFVSFSYLFYLVVVFRIEADLAGIVVGVSKLWDAIIDPVIGSLIERTRSRFGNKRPFLLYGTIPLGLSMVLLFASPVLPPDLKIVWAFATYILFCTAMSVVNIPYAALTVSITNNTEERTVVSSWRMTFALVGTLVAGGVGPLLISLLGNGQAAYSWSALIFAGVMVIVIFITFGGVREVATEPKRVADSLKAQLKSIFTNGPFLILSLASFLILTAVNILASVVKFFFTYNLAAPGSDAIGLSCLFVSAVVYLPLLAWLSKRFGKRNAYMTAMLIFVAVLVLLYFVAATGMVTVVICFVVAGIGVSAIFLMPWSMVADTIEYSQWKTGVRPEGAIYGYFLFMIKAAQAFAGFIQGSVIAVAGFVAPQLGAQGYSATTGQSPQALNGITLLLSLIPAGLVILGVLVLSRYPLSRARHEELKAEIAKRA